MTNILAFIPARGGSKGIPRKNTILCGGYPLIYWTIQAAFDSNFISRTFLSTDDSLIVKTTEEFGLYTSYFRPTHF